MRHVLVGRWDGFSTFLQPTSDRFDLDRSVVRIALVSYHEFHYSIQIRGRLYTHRIIYTMIVEQPFTKLIRTS